MKESDNGSEKQNAFAAQFERTLLSLPALIQSSASDSEPITVVALVAERLQENAFLDNIQKTEPDVSEASIPTRRTEISALEQVYVLNMLEFT